MTIIQGGTQANYTGTILEKYITDRLDERGYTHISREKFMPARYLKQPLYARKFRLCKTIYGANQEVDFIVYHPDLWPDNLVIESKWQQSGGTVDEKFPYLVLNIMTQYKTPTIILLDGGGYKKGAEAWLRRQSHKGDLLDVFGMNEFNKWVNQGKL
jgi:hypothetical protein